MSLASVARNLKRLSGHGTGNLRDGARALLRGAQYLRVHRALWPLLAVPVLINLVVFALFLFGISRVLAHFLSMALPETWWAMALIVIAVVAALAAVLFVGTAAIMFVGSLISAPFYAVLAERIARERGAVVVVLPFWTQAARGFANTFSKVGWFLLVQGVLLGLYAVPFAFGPVAYATTGFFATSFFLALDAFDFTFDLQGMTFRARIRWCFAHRRTVLGFGGAVFVGLALPGVNLLVPAAAVAGAALLYDDARPVA